MHRGRLCIPEAHDDGVRADAVVDAIDIADWRDRLLQVCTRHDGVRLVGTGAEAMARALSRAMGIGDEIGCLCGGIERHGERCRHQDRDAAGPQLADVPPNDMVADAVAETGPLAGAASYGLCGHRPAPHAGWPSDWLTVGAGLRRLSFTTCPAAPSSRWRLTSNGRARWRRGNGRPACGSGNGRRPRWWSGGSSRYPTRSMWTRRNDWGSRWSAGARVAARWWSSREGRSPIRCTRRDGSWTA